MRNIFFLAIIACAFLFNPNALSAQSTAAAGTTTKFKVYGNCGMCEKRIEKAAKIKGVQSADWDVETKILTVHFNENKTKPSKMQAAVAAVGHDTEKVKAKDAVYNKLHGCCQYEREQ